MVQTSYLLPVVVGIVIIRVLFSFMAHRRENTSAKLSGCAPAQQMNPGDIFGLRTLMSAIHAKSTGTLPLWWGQRFDALGENRHTFKVELGLSQPLVTRDEGNIKAMLATQIDDWRLGEVRGNLFKKFEGANLFTLEGHLWKQSRSFARSVFSREIISNLSKFERHVQDFFEKIPLEADGWTKVFDLQPLFFHLSTDIITEVLYGYSVYSLDPQKRLRLAEELGTTNLPDSQKFLNNLKTASDYIAFASLFGKYHKYLPSPWFYYHRYHFRRYTEWFVDRRLKEISSSKAGLEERSGEHFVFLDELSNVSRDPIQLRDETTGLLIAGHRTTASLLSWTLYYLARLPKIYQKLRSIILSEFSEDFDFSGTTVTELRKCKYLQFCLFESLRISSIIPAIAREAARDTTLPRGGGPDGSSPIFVPEGTVVMGDLFGLHHRSDIWGQDAEEFRPERWEGQELSWQFCPFGGGPRICPGQQLALTEVFYVMVRFVQRFDRIENMDSTDHVVHDVSISNRPGTGVIVKIHQA